MMRCTLVLAALLPAGAIFAAAPVLKPGGEAEFTVEMPMELRVFAGGGRPVSVRQVRIAVAVPADFDPAREWPVMVISATSDPGFNSSRQLLGYYAPQAIAAGWILIAADPKDNISRAEDHLQMRFALVNTALAGLEQIWPGAAKAPLAFGGFSGGAKHSGWLAAEFTAVGRRPIGVFQAGINKDTLALGARQLKILDDSVRGIPVFLLSGRKDDIATPFDHRDVEAELRRAGFKHVRLESFDGPHAVDPRPLRKALEWFSEQAKQSAPAK